LLNLDGLRVTQLTDGADLISPAWSQMASGWRSRGLPGASDIYTVNADGTGLANVSK
jgi:hypothetical protein